MVGRKVFEVFVDKVLVALFYPIFQLFEIFGVTRHILLLGSFVLESYGVHILVVFEI